MPVSAAEMCRASKSVDQNRVLLTSEFVLRANFFLLIVHVTPLHSSIFDGFEQHHVLFFKNYLLLTRTCKGRAICFKIRSWSKILDADLHLM